MWLVLCSAHDVAALWAYQGLQARGLRPLELVTAEMLANGCRWEHTVGASGPHISITLSDGRTFNQRRVRGVLNRLMNVRLEHLAKSPDYDYASQEYTAFFMSWLHALPEPVLNRAHAQGLCGAWRHVSEWVCLAARAGLQTPVYRQTSHDLIDESQELRRLFPPETKLCSAIVVGKQVIAPPRLPRETRAACLRLAQLSETPLLGIELTTGAGRVPAWTFAGATPLPDLRLGGEALLDALARELYQS